jgi:hypothetical protein
MKAIVVAVGLFAIFVLVLPAHGASRPSWRWAVASAYSASSTGSSRQGCPNAPALRDDGLSIATLLVPCGTSLRLCYRGRCVNARRWDSGPYVAGRQIDLNVGVVRALGVRDCASWGVRSLRWRRT